LFLFAEKTSDPPNLDRAYSDDTVRERCSGAEENIPAWCDEVLAEVIRMER
jgi:hypothetical protein